MRLATLCLLLILVPGCRWFRDADDTAYAEFKASSLLQKYEWFKDAAAKLDAKIASIKVAESRITSMEKSYAGVSRKDWPRVDAEQYNVWQQEVAGLKASYNTLAADYNARMVKENYRFCNEGELPKGATQPLPREFKPYMEN